MDWVIPKTFEQSKKYLLVFTAGMIILTAAINLFAPLNPAYNCEGYTPVEKTAKGTKDWNTVSSFAFGPAAALVMYMALKKIHWWTFDQIESWNADTYLAKSTRATLNKEWYGFLQIENMSYIIGATILLVIMTATSVGAHNDEDNSKCKHPTHGWNIFALIVACVSFIGACMLWIYQYTAD